MSLEKNLNIVFNEIKSENKKRLVVDKSHHNMFDTNPDQKKIFNEILNFLKN